MDLTYGMWNVTCVCDLCSLSSDLSGQKRLAHYLKETLIVYLMLENQYPDRIKPKSYWKGGRNLPQILGRQTPPLG